LEKDLKQDLTKQGLVFYCNKCKNNAKFKQFGSLRKLKRKVKAEVMKKYNIRRNSTVKANAPIVKLMNLIWGL
jgi:uncharacterized protein YlbG (UPF0298 family)